MGSERNKIEPAHGLSVPISVQFEAVIRNPDDKVLKYFQLFWSDGAYNRRWKKVQSDPMLIFLSGSRPLHAQHL
jgi:hypothetical protein